MLDIGGHHSSVELCKICVGRVRAANPYDEDTDVDSDEEQPGTANMPLPQLPNFFNGKCFHLHEELSADVRSKLTRYITAFSG
jgi:DNA-repair protein XRCC1